MKGEKGFTLIELLMTLCIVALIAGGGAAVVFQVLSGAERASSHTASVSQVQDAGYWISHDAQMADSVVVDGLQPPDLLVLNWTQRNYANGETTYHSVTYSLQELSDAVGRLRRSHWSSAGANEHSIVAEHIYYDPADLEKTSKASYTSPVLSLQLTSSLGEVTETREYRIIRRPNF